MHGQIHSGMALNNSSNVKSLFLSAFEMCVDIWLIPQPFRSPSANIISERQWQILFGDERTSYIHIE